MQIIEKFGTILYLNDNGKLHNDTGPAIIYPSGMQLYYNNGSLHRLTGPAKIFPNGISEYWIGGIQYTIQEFKLIAFFYC